MIQSIGLGIGVLGAWGMMLSPAIAQIQLTGSLTVQVEGIDHPEGNVCFKLFTGGQGFPNDNDSAVLRQCVAIEAIPMTVTFENLPVGNYAIAIYHDRNGDEELNRGAFGIPIEGYGFSNDAPADTGPARFEDAMFLLGNSETVIPITMRYPDFTE